MNNSLGLMKKMTRLLRVAVSSPVFKTRMQHSYQQNPLISGFSRSQNVNFGSQRDNYICDGSVQKEFPRLLGELFFCATTYLL